MPDENGVTLQPGDPVLLRDGNGGVSATILHEVGESRYLIQLDVPSLPRAERVQRLPGSELVDTQEPFEVEGSRLVFTG